MANLFERLGQPSPAKAKIQQPHKDDAAQRLLTWLQRWPKPTVSPRDIRVYGPNSLRNQKSAIDAAEVLVRNGWLVPVTTRRHSERAWQIVRKLIVSPIVAA
jgi:hypothetical protein